MVSHDFYVLLDAEECKGKFHQRYIISSIECCINKLQFHLNKWTFSNLLTCSNSTCKNIKLVHLLSWFAIVAELLTQIRYLYILKIRAIFASSVWKISNKKKHVWNIFQKTVLFQIPIKITIIVNCINAWVFKVALLRI